jgi:2-oxo-4-hydroxy-4-carboxy-5-ureidoimidazoline decarboxylase
MHGIYPQMSNEDESKAVFVTRYGGIYEHSAWVAEQTVDEACQEHDIEALAELFAECVDNSSHERRLALIKSHPDLAGRAAISGELTEASNEEQASAGIDQCSPEEFARFQDLNERYKAKFDFPFVMAVRKSNRNKIFAAFETRLSNDSDDEFEQAIAEIHKIARLRLAAEEQ